MGSSDSARRIGLWRTRTRGHCRRPRRAAGVRSSGTFKTMPGMAQRFIACDREQSFLMPPDVRDWLPADHFAWFVIDAVTAMDLEAFYAAYRADGRSRPAFDPAMMVALLLYAHAR